ncbi:hypothetical protein SGFS_055890 [Streptomyces graminofaciens]|uniref:Uncharacterized protein n=1 Tax=Streptomyces graminofaciens TaxID=68212 RepID=A0ABN5VP18_9ACTN|nr:hypothetical protein [Streptomyces graminofaciens]BBC34295.1 hypothetical protein SGFS_055890 [Streptomyces graminofaciens]
MAMGSAAAVKYVVDAQVGRVRHQSGFGGVRRHGRRPGHQQLGLGEGVQLGGERGPHPRGQFLAARRVGVGRPGAGQGEDVERVSPARFVDAASPGSVQPGGQQRVDGVGTERAEVDRLDDAVLQGPPEALP